MSVTHCWLCQGEAREWKARNLPARLTPDDLQITDAHYGRTLLLLRCTRCGFVFADGDELAELEQFYARLIDHGYLESSEGRRLQMSWMLARMPRFARGQTLLDVGCAAGLLLEEAGKLGLDATGIEPSAALVEQARQAGQRVIHGVLPHPELSEKRFDVVSLMDVIEHVADPVGLLRVSAAQLARGGAMLVVTPDLESVTAKLLGHRWWHLRVAHVCYFSERTMALAAEKAGLVIEEAFRPRWFFPVPYLLERVQKYFPLPLPKLDKTRLNRLIVPLQLGDSWAFVLRKKA